MQNSLKPKLASIFANMKSADLIVLLNTNYRDPNFIYITGFKSGIFEFTFTIIKRNGIEILANELEFSAAKSQATKGMRVIKISRLKQQRNYLSKQLNKKTIALDEPFIPYTFYNAIRKRYKPKRIVDASEAFANARLIKDPNEIKCISKAAGITKGAMSKITTHFKEGISEKELARIFNSISEELGSEGPSFDTIVCFGKNAAMPHHSPDNTRLKSGDFVLIDAGAKFNNYCSDITRTWIFGKDIGKIRDYKEKINIYNTVRDAQRLAIAAIKPGVRGKDIHIIARDHINAAFNGKYKGKFIHSLGHSVGIEVHDGAGFSEGAEQIIKPGMVITVEPGIYINGFGGVRIEDDVLVTRQGHKVL